MPSFWQTLKFIPATDVPVAHVASRFPGANVKFVSHWQTSCRLGCTVSVTKKQSIRWQWRVYFLTHSIKLIVDPFQTLRRKNISGRSDDGCLERHHSAFWFLQKKRCKKTWCLSLKLHSKMLPCRLFGDIRFSLFLYCTQENHEIFTLYKCIYMCVCVCIYSPNLTDSST